MTQEDISPVIGGPQQFILQRIPLFHSWPLEIPEADPLSATRARSSVVLFMFWLEKDEHFF